MPNKKKVPSLYIKKNIGKYKQSGIRSADRLRRGVDCVENKPSIYKWMMKKQNIRTLSLIVCTFTYLLIGAAVFGNKKKLIKI